MFLRPAITLAALHVLVFAQSATAGEAEIDTDRLFSYSAGSDLGDPGEKEVQWSLADAFGHAGGSYAVGQSQLAFQYTLRENFQISLSTEVSAARVENVPNLDDRRGLAFGGLSVGFGYRLLNRADHAIGVAVYAEPRWIRVDDDNGAPVQGVGTDFSLAMDRELVPGKLVGVVNLVYQPQGSRPSADGSWSREATAGLTAGLSMKVGRGLFVGWEAQYLRKYESVGLGSYAGDAVFLGPSLSVNLSGDSWIFAGWNTQITVHPAVAVNAALNLTTFSHHLVRVGLGMEF